MNHEKKLRYANEELIVHGNLDVIGEIFSPEYVAHAGDKDYSGHDFIRSYAGILRTAIPDITVQSIEILNHDTSSSRVAWLRSLSGTHKASMLGIPPSGKNLAWQDMVVSRFDGDLIAEEWVVSDLAAQLMFKLSKQG